MANPFIHMEILYPNDAVLRQLLTEYKLHLFCRSIRKQGWTDDEACQHVERSLIELELTPPAASFIVDLCHRYRDAGDDFLLNDALDYAVFTIEMGVDRRHGEIWHEETYRPLLDASPVPAAGYSPGRFLSALYPNAQNVLVCWSSRGARPGIWNDQVYANVDIHEPWFWPLPVVYDVEADEDDLVIKTEAVATWSSAVKFLSGDDIVRMTPLILARALPVRAIVDTPHGICTIFGVNANSKDEWHAQSRLLRAQLKAIGIDVSPFKYNWIAHMPGVGLNRLIYLAP